MSDLSAGSAVVDLLGLVAYGELLAFDRMAADARLAPDLDPRAVLSEMAAVRIINYRRLADRLAELGVPPGEAMGSPSRRHSPQPPTHPPHSPDSSFPRPPNDMSLVITRGHDPSKD